MSSFLYRAILISCSTGLTACATQGYPGPQLPDDQTAKVSLASPSIAWLPPFWVFPLNLLPRLDEDWKNTVDYNIDVDGQELNRFDLISLLPGPHHASAQYTVINSDLIGSKTCTSSDSKYAREDRSESCTRTTTCKGLFKFTEREHKCSLDFSAEAGEAYELAVTNPAEGEIRLSLRDISARQPDLSNACYWTPDRSHDEYVTDTATSDCSIKTEPPTQPVPDILVERDDKRHVHEPRDHDSEPGSHPHSHPHIDHPHPLLEAPGISHKHEDRPFNRHERHDHRDTASDRSDSWGNHPRKPGKHEHPGNTDIIKQEDASPTSFEVNNLQDTVPGSENGRHPDKDLSKMPYRNMQSQTLNSETASRQNQNDGIGASATNTLESMPSASNSASKSLKTEKSPSSDIDPNANSSPIPSSESNIGPNPYSLKASDSKITESNAPNKDNTSGPVNTAPVEPNRQSVPAASVQSDSLSVKDIAAPAPSHGNSDLSDSNLPSAETGVEPPVNVSSPSDNLPGQSPSTSPAPAIKSIPSADSKSNSTSTSSSFGSSSANSNTTSRPVPEPASTPNPSYSPAPVSSPSSNDSSSSGNTSSSTTSEPAPISTASSSSSSASSSSSSSNDGSSSSSPNPAGASSPAAPAVAPSPSPAPIPEPPVAPALVAPATPP